MQTDETVDYLIAGQGLAGSCLSVQLLRRKKKIRVLDLPMQNHASFVAAGLFNPLTGRVMARTWLADELFPYLFKFYQEAEEFLQRRFFFPREIYRPFLSVQEQNGWMGKSADEAFRAYIRSVFTRPSVENVNDPFGGILLTRSGHVDVPLFLASVREHLKAGGSWQEESLDPAALEVYTDHVRYRNLKAKGVIFCEGMSVSKNHFFNWLPINPLKGETISVAMEPLSYILNRGVYVVGDKVGATYDFTSRDPGVTETGRFELEGKLRDLVTLPFEVTAQNWGIRPTTLDQKIMIGSHPKWGNVMIFNGLGTKGVSQAPYFSEQLAGWLAGENEILREVNIQRYNALYSKSLK